MKSRRAEKNRRRKQRMLNSKRRIQYRLRDRDWDDQDLPMLRASNIDYEIADRTRAVSAGGIGLIHRLVHRLGLPAELDKRVSVLKRHLPYHESDHVLNIAYNVLAGGTCLEDIEIRRNDEAFLDALGAQRIPDPTTAGDFCRRFLPEDIEALMDAVNAVRLRVWKEQDPSFFEEARIDADGTIAATSGECKLGMDLSYKGIWGYHPLVVSLANTQEPLYLVNRSGNRHSHEGSAERIDQAIALCNRAGFRRISVRGDTAFCQTGHFDRWDAMGVRFVFSSPAFPGHQTRAMEIDAAKWRLLKRERKYDVKTRERTRPENVKDRIVRDRGYRCIRLESEEVSELQWKPTKCSKPYRLVVVRKSLTVERGQLEIVPDERYLFYLTNDWDSAPEEIVFASNARCDQENLIEQLKNGVGALRMPVDTLESNWAYMVMASLAWSLKAWCAQLLPTRGRWREKYAAEKARVLRMEFKRFVDAFIKVPAQIVRSGRRIVYRLLSWNPYQHIFLRAVEVLHRPLRC